jgi:hypothetical protein
MFWILESAVTVSSQSSGTTFICAVNATGLYLTGRADSTGGEHGIAAGRTGLNLNDTQ